MGLLRKWIDAARCLMRRCGRCRVISTDEGIGGQCDRCGRIYGWITRNELADAIRGEWRKEGK